MFPSLCRLLLSHSFSSSSFSSHTLLLTHSLCLTLPFSISLSVFLCLFVILLAYGSLPYVSLSLSASLSPNPQSLFTLKSRRWRPNPWRYLILLLFFQSRALAMLLQPLTDTSSYPFGFNSTICTRTILIHYNCKFVIKLH